MDNITHSLIACGAARVLEPAFQGRLTARQRTAFYVSSLIANNIPDGDFAFALFNPDAKMGSLLHHRGFTHSVLAVPVLGLLSAALALAICGVWQTKAREGRGSRAPVLATVLAGLLGIVLHVLADSWNDYGVHPFTPFWNRWFYGDTRVIVEPLLWLALVWAIPEGTGRNGTLLTVARRGVVILSLGLLCFYPGMQWPVTAWSLLCAGALYLFQRRVKRPALLWAPPAALVLTFSFCSSLAKDAIARNITAQIPVEDAHGAVVGVVDPHVKGLSRITDILVSPSPSNPFCWRGFVQLEQAMDDSGPRLTTHMGYVSLWPGVLPAATCHVRRPMEASARGRVPEVTSDSNVHWVRTSSASLDDMRAYAQGACRFREFLAFARYPFLQKSGGDWVYGDLRYDFNRAAGFAEFSDEQSASGPCLRIPAPWVTPLLRKNVIQL